jgi:hypothetical protein
VSLYEFIVLSEQEQAEVTWQGEYFLSREEREHTIMLYKVYVFYVEVYYNNTTNEIERFNPFFYQKSGWNCILTCN